MSIVGAECPFVREASPIWDFIIELTYPGFNVLPGV